MWERLKWCWCERVGLSFCVGSMQSVRVCGGWELSCQCNSGWLQDLQPAFVLAENADTGLHAALWTQTYPQPSGPPAVRSTRT